MLNRAHRALREHRVTVYTAALLCLLFFHMLWYVNFFLAESLAGTYFLYPIPVLTAFYLYFRGLRDGPEIKLLLLFSLWLALTRVLNGRAISSTPILTDCMISGASNVSLPAMRNHHSPVPCARFLPIMRLMTPKLSARFAALPTHSAADAAAPVAVFAR